MKLHSTKTLIQAQRRLMSNDDNVDFERAKEIANLLARRGLIGFTIKDGASSSGWWVSVTRSGFPDEVTISSSGSGGVGVDIYMHGTSGRARGRNTDIAWDDAVKAYVKNASKQVETSKSEIRKLEESINVVGDYITMFNRI